MTTNEDRAQRIVGGVIDRLTADKSGVPVATRITQALADDGLLMLDLPAPRMVDRYPGSVCWEVCTDPSVAARRHIGVRVDHIHRITVNIVGEASPAEAREATYALLAAANHAGQEQCNE